MLGIKRALVNVNKLNRHLKRIESIPQVNSEVRKATRISNGLEDEIKDLYKTIFKLRKEVDDA
jgi:hypothetical protein